MQRGQGAGFDGGQAADLEPSGEKFGREPEELLGRGGLPGELSRVHLLLEPLRTRKKAEPERQSTDLWQLEANRQRIVLDKSLEEGKNLPLRFYSS